MVVSAPPVPDSALPTLEILLVPTGPDDPQANLEAAYIAQRTQQIVLEPNHPVQVMRAGGQLNSVQHRP